MEITIFAWFHALAGKEEEEVASKLRDAVTRASTEPGCLGIQVYRSVRDPRLFWRAKPFIEHAHQDGM